MSNFFEFGYDGKKPVPARPEAEAFADAMTEFMEARQELTEAQDKVPDYTGQWDSKDYYAAQQERYNRATDALADAIKGVFG